MFKNYLITALRNLLRDKGSSAMNLAGLTLGITGSLILFLLVEHMATFDSFHTKRDRIFRVVTEMDGNASRFYTPGIPKPLPDAFREDFPEAEEVTFTSYRSGALIRIPQEGDVPKKFHEEAGVVFAQSNFFRIFDRKILSGDALTALDEPHQAAIARSLAKKYFGTEEVIGEIVLHDTVEYTITSVMEDPPGNTDLPFTLMLSYATIQREGEQANWGSIWSDEHCYVLLKDGASAHQIAARMGGFVEKYIGKENLRDQTFNLQPLSELHFDPRYSTYSHNTSPREILVALAVVAAFLILTACINFVNLSTAEAIKRSKEVGIRKALGSSRAQLIFQFFGEATMVTFFAMLLSLGMTEIALGLVGAFLEIPLKLDLSGDPLLWGFVIGVTVLVSLLAGLYPSLIISGFKPVSALRNRINNGSSSGYNLRRTLVVLQFFISQFFIMGTIVLLSQMKYFRSQDMGFRKDAILVLPIPEREYPGQEHGASRMRTLRDQVDALAGVDLVSLSNTPPSSGSVNSTGFYFEGEGGDNRKDTHVKQADAHYLRLYDIKLLAGENIADDDTAQSVLVNEEFVRISGVPDPRDIIGKRIHFWGRTLPIAGVVSDFHMVSLRDPMAPLILMNNIEGYRTMSVRLNAANVRPVVDEIRARWEAAYPEHLFDYKFFDESIQEFYEGEERLSAVLTVFTFMVICIGCLGLFGLATFMTNQKTKEIGVRKALGASVESILYRFSIEYVKLICIGFVIAAPLVWFLMNEWLATFAYKITIGPMIFVTGLLLTLIIALLTVGYRSFKAAVMNPIKSLRYE